MVFRALSSFLDSLSSDFGVPCCRMVVYKDHKKVFTHSAGYSDLAGDRPASADDLYWIYSATKLSTCTAVMQLAEKGSLRLNDPVSVYLPEYGAVTVRTADSVHPSEKPIRILDLMTMSAGLSYALDTPEIQKVLAKYGEAATTRQLATAFAETPLQFEPGTRFCYSLCHDVLAAVVETVTRDPFSVYLEKNVFEPLGIEDIHFHFGRNELGRLAAQYEMEPDGKMLRSIGPANRYVLSEAYESGGAGICTTCDEYAKLMDALACGGVGANGGHILTRDSIDQMRTNRLDPVRLRDFELMQKVGYGYGLGVRTLLDPSASRSPLGEFGWDGAAGAYGLSDPVNRIGIFFTTHILGYERLFLEVHPKLRDLTYECLDL